MVRLAVTGSRRPPALSLASRWVWLVGGMCIVGVVMVLCRLLCRVAGERTVRGVAGLRGRRGVAGPWRSEKSRRPTGTGVSLPQALCPGGKLVSCNSPYLIDTFLSSGLAAIVVSEGVPGPAHTGGIPAPLPRTISVCTTDWVPCPPDTLTWSGGRWTGTCTEGTDWTLARGRG